MTSRTYNSTQADNPLCQRMQKQFRDRVGTAVRAGSRTETSELLNRVRQGLDPYENAPDPTKKTVSDVRRRPAGQGNAPASRAASQSESVSRSRCASSASARVSGMQGSASRNASRPTASAASVQRSGQVRPVEAEETGLVRSLWNAWRENRRAVKLSRRQLKNGEVLVRAPFPVTGLFMLILLTLMALVLLLSFSQNYELQGKISALHEDAYRLEQLQRSLEIQLEERDDIRVIEKIAVEELGMVKYDLVESRFVSVSGGDRIELTEEETQAVESGLWSTMLSAVGESFSRVREYIE